MIHDKTDQPSLSQSEDVITKLVVYFSRVDLTAKCFFNLGAVKQCFRIKKDYKKKQEKTPNYLSITSKKQRQKTVCIHIILNERMDLKHFSI